MADDRLAGLMAVQRERFAVSQRPLVPAPGRQDTAPYEHAGWLQRRGETHLWQRGKRIRVRMQIHAAALAHVEDVYQRSVLAAQQEQARADDWWAALSRGDPQVTRAALNAAFANDRAGVQIMDLDGTKAVLALVLPGTNVLPLRRPHITPGGRMSTKAWTQTDFNETYAGILAAHLLATLRETWAVAPSLQRVRVVGLRIADGDLEVLFDVAVMRAYGNWADDDWGREILDQSDHGLNRMGRTREVLPYPATSVAPDVARWVH